MAGVSQQCERVGEQTKDDFQQDEAKIQRNANQELATEILGRMMVAMFVMGVPHGERAP